MTKLNPLLEIATLATAAEARGHWSLAKRLDHIGYRLQRIALDQPEIDLKDPNLWKKDVNGDPMAVYLMEHHPNLVPEALKRHDVATVKDSEGMTPLSHFAFSNDRNVQHAVLKHPEVGKVKDAHGYTPLHHLAAIGDEPIQYLVLKNPDVAKATDARGRTPLHVLAEEGGFNVAQAVLKHPEANKVKNRGGQTPADIVKDRGNKFSSVKTAAGGFDTSSKTQKDYPVGTQLSGHMGTLFTVIDHLPNGDIRIRNDGTGYGKGQTFVFSPWELKSHGYHKKSAVASIKTAWGEGGGGRVDQSVVGYMGADDKFYCLHHAKTSQQKDEPILRGQQSFNREPCAVCHKKLIDVAVHDFGVRASLQKLASAQEVIEMAKKHVHGEDGIKRKACVG